MDTQNTHAKTHMTCPETRFLFWTLSLSPSLLFSMIGHRLIVKKGKRMEGREYKEFWYWWKIISMKCWFVYINCLFHCTVHSLYLLHSFLPLIINRIPNWSYFIHLISLYLSFLPSVFILLSFHFLTHHDLIDRFLLY